MVCVFTLVLGFGLGLLHALDPDHLAAVSTFVSRNPRKRQSARFALEWGIGHCLSLLALSVTLLLLGKGMNVHLERALETCVGMMLIGLGLWGLWEVFLSWHRVHSHPHEDDSGQSHEHFHRHSLAQDTVHEDHSHVAGFIGLLHGAAGTARFLVLIPIALMGSLSQCLQFILSFSAGVIAAMMVYAFVLGHFFDATGRRFQHLAGVYRPLTAAVSLAVGIYWIAQ